MFSLFLHLQNNVCLLVLPAYFNTLTKLTASIVVAFWSSFCDLCVILFTSQAEF